MGMKGKEAMITGNGNVAYFTISAYRVQKHDGPGIRIHLPDGKKGTTVYGDPEHKFGHRVLYNRLTDILEEHFSDEEEPDDED